MALARHRELSAEDNLPVENFPLRSERHDVFAIRHPYDHIRGNIIPNSSQFCYNASVRDKLLHLRFDQHAWEHRMPCFKKGDECRSNLPVPEQKEWDVEFDGRPWCRRRITRSGHGCCFCPVCPASFVQFVQFVQLVLSSSGQKLSSRFGLSK